MPQKGNSVRRVSSITVFVRGTPSTLWEETLLSSVVTDAAPECNASASGSLHAEPSTPVGPDT